MGKPLTRYLLGLFVLSALIFSSCRIDDGNSVALLPLTYQTFDAFFEGEGEPSQFFNENANQDILVTGEKGTSILIPANSLMTNGGSLVNGNVDIELKEILDKGDMILSNKSTLASNGAVLESGGEFFISVTQNDQALELANPYTIIAPINSATAAPEEMNLFFGDNQENGIILWELADESAVTLTTSTIGGGNPVNVYEVLADQFNWINIDYFYNASNTTNVEFTPISFEGTLSDVACFIVFRDINAVIRMEYDEVSGLLSKGNLPVGENIEVVLLATNSDVYYLGMEALTVSENMSKDISMRSMSLEDLVKEIRRLN